MFEGLFGGRPGRHDPRVEAYREAKRLYEDYLAGVLVPFHMLTPEIHRQARDEPSLKRALDLYQKALDLSIAAGTMADASTARYLIGLILHLQGHLLEAREAFRESLAIAESLPSNNSRLRRAVGLCHHHLGVLAGGHGDLQAAAGHLHRALTIADEEGEWGETSRNRDAIRFFDLPEEPLGPSVLFPGIFGDSESGHWARSPGPAAGEEDSPAIGPSSQAGAQPPPDRSSSKSETESIEPPRAITRGDDFHTDVIWIVSYSEEENQSYTQPLKESSAQLPRPLSVCQMACSGIDPHQLTPPPLQADERLVGAILVLEKKGLNDPAFRELTNWCVSRLMEADDFRLFVGFTDGLAPEDIRRLAESGDGVCDRLFGVVQLLDDASPEAVKGAVIDYLRRVDEIRLVAAGRRLIEGIHLDASRVALAVELAALVLVALAVGTLGLLGKGSSSAQWVAAWPELTGLITGLLTFAAQTPVLYMLLRGPSSHLERMKSPVLSRSFSIGLVVCLGATWVNSRANSPPAWNLLGFALGAVLEIARRSGISAIHRGLDLKRCLSLSEKPELPHQVSEAAQGVILGPFRCPILPPTAPQVFLSYSRPLPWSRDLASRLYDGLRNHNVNCFLDRFSLPKGGNWPRVLHRRITQATVLLMLVEPKTLDRPWVATELLIALVSKFYTGLPEIVLLVRPDALGSPPTGVLPVFRAVFHGHLSSDPYYRPIRVIPVRKEELTEQMILAGIHQVHAEAAALFPGSCSRAGGLTLFPFFIVGRLCFFPGLVAFVCAILACLAPYHLSAVFPSRGAMEAAYLLLGYWLGFGARLALATRLELRWRSAFWTYALSALGLGLVFSDWSREVSWLALGWGVCLALWGWIASSLYLQSLARSNSGFLGSQE